MTQTAPQSQRLLNEQELFAIYLEVARADHAWRRRSFYGDQTPPESHTPFRPLNAAIFSERFRGACTLADGHQRFQAQLLRRASFYKVDTAQALRGVATSKSVACPAVISGPLPTPGPSVTS